VTSTSLLRRTVLVSVLLTALAGCGAHTLPEIHSEAERLATARRLYADNDIADATELLKSYTASSSGAADVDEAIYLLGLCYLKTKDWTLAEGQFERVVRDYPESDSSASASFRLGEAYYGQSRQEDFDQEYTLKALEQWQTYMRSYQGHWLNTEAAKRILQARTRLANKLADNGTLYMKLRLYEPAKFYFHQVVQDYSDTSAIQEAELGLAMCSAHEGRKPEAIAALRDIEVKYKGQIVAKEAAHERRRLEH
jgi:outer membrane protein assembly factor BamD